MQVNSRLYPLALFIIALLAINSFAGTPASASDKDRQFDFTFLSELTLLPPAYPVGTIIYSRSSLIGNEYFDDIYILESNGALTQLTNGAGAGTPFDNVFPDWKPDGTLVVYTTTKFDPNAKTNTEIMTVDVSNPGNVTRLTNHAAYDEAPSWSPNGTKIAFESNRHNVATGVHQIYVMDSDGSNVTRLTTNALEDQQPKWSRDGSKIAFDRRSGAAGQRIVVINADGSNETPLSPLAGFDRGPDWSPDGTRIVFSSNRHAPSLGNFEIYIMDSVDADSDGMGDNLVRLTNTAVNNQNFHPFWSPDGTKIFFGSNRNGTHIYSMDTSGGNVMQVTTNSSFKHGSGRFLY